MRDIAEKNGVTGYLSVGGNMLVIGKKPNGKDIIIGIRNPLGSENDYFAKDQDRRIYNGSIKCLGEIFLKRTGSYIIIY